MFLGLVALTGLLLPPSRPAPASTMLFAVLLLYFVAALVVTTILARGTPALRQIAVVTHCGDIAFATALVSLTGGSASPLFIYFVFALVAATLRWDRRSLVWTGVVAGVAYVAAALVAEGRPGGNLLVGEVLAMRLGYLAVATVLLASIAAYQTDWHRDLLRLAAWPQPAHLEQRALLRELLAHSGTLLHAQSSALLWRRCADPDCSLTLAEWRDGTLHVEDFDDGSDEQDLPSAPGSDVLFFARDSAGDQLSAWTFANDRLTRTTENAVGRLMTTRIQARNILAAPVSGEHARGWLLAMDIEGSAVDRALVATVASRVVTTQLDVHYGLALLRRAEVNEARVRLARDLHDDVLQALTSIALMVAAADRAIESDPARAREILERASDEIIGRQRQLRGLIGQLRGADGRMSQVLDLGAALAEVSLRVRALWGVHVSVHVSEEFSSVDQRTLREIYLIAHEGIINAARHAAARNVSVTISAERGRAAIHVEDDGRGFPYRGVFDLTTLEHLGLGPTVLKERVGALEGSLRLESTESGARLDISVPLGAS